MPQVKIERIVSFTSEDTVHTASNILSTDISKKWKCKTAGEKCASVVLQLDQPYVITGIDIGNEHSAYVEVLVARSSAPDDFQVFLVMSSFMTPLESRQSQNVNKVRMFKQEDFIDDRRNDKWDRIKIVCSQPFNRHVQYGLAFIKLHSSDGINSEQLTQTSIGQFIIRPASPDIFAAGSLFARKKENEEKPSTLLLKGAAAIREAANSGSINPKQKHNLPVTPKPQIKKVNNEDIDRTTTSNRDTFRNELLYTKDEENNERINKVIEKRNKEKEASNKIKQDQIHANKNTPSKDMKKRKTDTPTKTPLSFKQDASSSSNTVLKRKQEQAKNVVKRVKREGKPFEKLLEDVTLVISGIQNPDRSNLRSMALAMGAKYKSDWDSTCTHLICAFINTPKFNQVKGKGKIVTRKWLDDCYSQRKKLPWRRHALDKSDKGTESEEEICEIENTPIVESLEQSSEVKSDTDEDVTETASDTDEKIEKIKLKQNVETINDIYSQDTDTEITDNQCDRSLEITEKLPDLFQDKMFYVDENLEINLVKKLKQYITAYGGFVAENMEASIDIIITDHSNSKVFRDIYPAGHCVAPDWIWKCHNCQSIAPLNEFIFN